MDIQYAQAAVYTSDFAFLVMESKRSNSNTEMTLIVDVDINLLKELHEHGSQHHEGQEHDLYSLKN
jgi:hypothetical protein